MSIEVNRKNILAIKEHVDITRIQLRDCQSKIKDLENLVLAQTNRIDLFQKQVQTIQMKLYSGGATS